MPHHFLLILTAIGLLPTILRAQTFSPATTNKKIIGYGQDYPNTAYVRANIRAMERRPYDGIVIGVSKSREPKLAPESIGHRTFSAEQFEPGDFQDAIDDLKATPFQRFTDNFIQVEAMPEHIDFFDDTGWNRICHNFKTLAHIAKQGGCRGLEFDPEEYGPHPWTYSAWPEALRKQHTPEQYIEKARQRGREAMQAINSEFPDVRILFLLGPSFTYQHVLVGNDRYRLLLPFIDGMCSAATNGTQITDGYEQSYPYRTPIAFAEGRKLQLASRELFEDKAAFDRVMRVGFGLWTDQNSGKLGWHPLEPLKNHFQPQSWQTAVHFGLAYSDEYVWTWHERFNIWTGENVSEAYVQAQADAREKPGVLVSDAPPDPNRVRHAAAVEGHDDAATFGDLQRTHTLLMDLPNTAWKFRVDPTDQGTAENWQRPDLDISEWQSIEVGKFWEEQGHDYDGVAWYRTTFKLDAPPAAKRKVILSIGAADESATMWLNGRQVAVHDVGEGGWDKRIDADVTSSLRPGENQLAVRVVDRVGPGGIWKSVKLFASAEQTRKKLIEYGWDCPDPYVIRDHMPAMEDQPFDGVVIRPIMPPDASGKRPPSLGRRVFSNRRIEEREYQHNIDLLKTIKFTKFTDNFIQLVTQPGDVNLFDDAGWQSILHNTRVIAKIARTTNCVGIMFDPEEYGEIKQWSYENLPEKWRKDRSRDQYVNQARLRGREFMRAINAEFPNVKILSLLGPSFSIVYRNNNRPDYSLLLPFYDGMCSVADGGSIIVDGYEQAYKFQQPREFAEGREQIVAARDLFTDKPAFDRVMRVGFGLWLDYGSIKGPWDLNDFSRNVFQPQSWKTAVSNALGESDEYVWVYAQKPNWWTGENLPPEYVAAQRTAKATSH